MKLITLSVALLANIIIFSSCQNRLSKNSNTSASTDQLPDTISDDELLLEPVEEVNVDLFVGNAVNQVEKKVDVFIHEISGYGTNEKFARAAVDTLKLILNSKGFKRAVENSTFDMDRGMSSKEIYTLIMKAREESGPGGQDGVVDIRMRTITIKEDGKKWVKACTTYRNGWITVGKDGGSSGKMATCPNWVEKRAKEKDYASMAAHVMHENMHILGFSHKNATDKRKTVPYKIGAIIEKLGNNPKPRN